MRSLIVLAVFAPAVFAASYVYADTAYDFPAAPYTPSIPAAVNDSRLAQIEQAWNAGDQGGTQAAFDRAKPRESAELGAQVKGTLKITRAVRIDFRQFNAPSMLAARAYVNGQPVIWILEECENAPGKFCGFWHRPATTTPYFGGAERGQALDVASTFIGINRGFSEGGAGGNAGLLFTIPFKAARLIQSHVTNDYVECLQIRTGDEMIGAAAGIKNLALIAGMPTPWTWALFGAAALIDYKPAVMRAAFDCAEIALGTQSSL